jgi:hypothetical protein
VSETPPLAVAPGRLLDLGRRQDDLILLTTSSMRARRSPRSIAGLWLWQTGLALLASMPAAGLARAAWSGDPDGDGALWTPGAHALLDWLWHDAHGVRAVFGAAEVILLVGAVLGLIPTAALMFEMAYVSRTRARPGLVRSLAGAMRAWPSMLLLFVLSGLVQATVLGLGVGLGMLAELSAHGGLGEARAQQIEGFVLLLVVAAASAVGVAGDLGRAAIVRFEVRGLRAFVLGMRTLRRSPAPLWWSWAWRAFAGIVLIVIGGVVAGRLGGRGGLALIVLALLHQAVVVSRIALRASWLARALRAVDATLRRAPP